MKYEEITIRDTISADRFVLRPCHKSDTGLIAMGASNDRVAHGTRVMPYPLPSGSVEATIEPASQADRTEGTWVIVNSAHGYAEALGLISLERMDSCQSEVFQDNLGSACVLTNYGFGYLGDAEDFLVSHNATWIYTLKVEE